MGYSYVGKAATPVESLASDTCCHIAAGCKCQCPEVDTIIERIAADACYAVADNDTFKSSAIHERRITYAVHAVGYNYAFKRVTVFEHLIAYDRNAFGNDDFRKRTATTECRIAYAFNAFGNNDFRKCAAIIECRIAYAFNAFGNNDFRKRTATTESSIAYAFNGTRYRYAFDGITDIEGLGRDTFAAGYYNRLQSGRNSTVRIAAFVEQVNERRISCSVYVFTDKRYSHTCKRTATSECGNAYMDHAVGNNYAIKRTATSECILPYAHNAFGQGYTCKLRVFERISGNAGSIAAQGYRPAICLTVDNPFIHIYYSVLYLHKFAAILE